jgi:hypothetical protein
VTCTITFTNPLPTLPTPPGSSSSTHSHRRRSSVRNSPKYSSRIQSPTLQSHTSSPLVRHGKQFSGGQHSRSQSLTLTSDIINGKDNTALTKNGAAHRRTGSTAQSLSVYDDENSGINRKTASFTDLASSTFAYFTGFSINGSQDQNTSGNYNDTKVEEDDLNDIEKGKLI